MAAAGRWYDDCICLSRLWWEADLHTIGREGIYGFRYLLGIALVIGGVALRSQVPQEGVGDGR